MESPLRSGSQSIVTLFIGKLARKRSSGELTIEKQAHQASVKRLQSAFVIGEAPGSQTCVISWVLHIGGDDNAEAGAAHRTQKTVHGRPNLEDVIEQQKATGLFTCDLTEPRMER